MNIRLLCGASLALLVAACGGKSTDPSERIPDYAGNWSGTYTITGCTQSGGVALANICGSLGSTPPYSFALTQSSRNVSGSFALGSIQFPSTGGSIASDGSLALSATTNQNGIIVIVNWALNMPASVITGTITQNWTSTTLSGSAAVAGSINNAIRSQGLTQSIRTFAPLTIHDVANAVAGR